MTYRIFLIFAALCFIALCVDGIFHDGGEAFYITALGIVLGTAIIRSIPEPEPKAECPPAQQDRSRGSGSGPYWKR